MPAHRNGPVSSNVRRLNNRAAASKPLNPMQYLWLALLTLTTMEALGQSAIGPGPALAVIKQFAHDFCGSDPQRLDQLRGTENRTELSASAKAGLSKLFKGFLDVGVDLSGKVTQSQYQGVLRSDIPKILADRQNCTITIYNSLVDRILDRQTRELSFSIKRSLDLLNMAEAPVKVGKSLFRPFFVQSPDHKTTSNGIELKVSAIKISGRMSTSTVSFALSAPGESSLTFEADEGTQVHLSMRACKPVSISVLSVFYTPTELVKRRVPIPQVPLRMPNGDPICLESQQSCVVNVELKARCKIDA